MDNREFFDRMADDYDRLYGSRPDTEPEDRLVIGYVADRLPENASVLDVGCGTGFFLDKVTWPRGLYRGFDISARMIERARAKHPGYAFARADALNGGWPVWRGSGPRWVIALWSVYYWTSPEVFMDLYRQYEPDGALLTAATERLDDDGGFSISEYEFDVIPWGADELLSVAGASVKDITPFAYGGKVVEEDEAHYLLVELR